MVPTIIFLMCLFQLTIVTNGSILDTVKDIYSNACVFHDNCYKSFYQLNNYCCLAYSDKSSIHIAAQCCDMLTYSFFEKLL